MYTCRTPLGLEEVRKYYSSPGAIAVYTSYYYNIHKTRALGNLVHNIYILYTAYGVFCIDHNRGHKQT